MSRVVAVVQARMGSSRLPGKSLVRLGDKPLIDHVVSRAHLASLVDDVVVAVPSSPEDDILAEHVRAHGLAAVYRGSSDDVLGRIVGAAKTLKGDVVVRLTADDPFKDPEIIDLLVKRLLGDTSLAFVNNVASKSFPEGLDVEVARYETLQSISACPLSPYDREHVTAALYRDPVEFPSHSLSWSEDLISWRLTLDTPRDRVFLDAVACEVNRRGAGEDLETLVSLIRGSRELCRMMPRSTRFRET